MPKKTSPTNQVLPTDKVLSVQQPLAQLLVSKSEYSERIPRKWIENRSWPVPKGLEWLLIHASAAKDHPEEYRDYGFELEECAHGAIIGYVRVIGCIQLKLNTDSDKESIANRVVFQRHCDVMRSIVEEYTGVVPVDEEYTAHISWDRDVFHWICVDPVMLKKPILCRGALRIWTLKTHAVETDSSE